MDEVRFKDLPATNNNRCSSMLENQMQCAERASIDVAPGVYFCKHHFAVDRVLNEAKGVKYIAYDMQGNRINEETETYQPPQK